MGDRANVKIYFENSAPIYLYTHWRGSEIYGIVKNALARKSRWGDAPYLARIIFCEMIKGYEEEETGFGISTAICDNEHTIIGVDCTTQTISFEGENGYVKSKISFEQMVNRKDKWSQE